MLLEQTLGQEFGSAGLASDHFGDHFAFGSGDGRE